MATGMAASLAAEAVPRTARDCNSASMTDHDDVVRASFSRQVGLFSGPDSPFVRRAGGAVVERREPHDPPQVARRLAGGARHPAPRGPLPRVRHSAPPTTANATRTAGPLRTPT